MTAEGQRPVYSAVVPVYNSGQSLLALADRLAAVFADTLGADYELIFVDDGSQREETRAVLIELARRPHVSVYRLTRNFGKAAAVICGLEASRGDWVITIDDDLQQKPEDIAALAAHRDRDVVIATYARKRHTLGQRISSRIKRRFDGIILGYPRPISPLKLLSRPVIDGMLQIATNRPFIPALIRQVSTDCHFVELEHAPSAEGKSRYTPWRRLRQFLDLLIGNSSLAMHGFAMLGFTFALASFALAMYLAARKLLGLNVETGWTSLMVTMLLVGGLNLMAFGLVGEYFIRLLDVSSKKPAYFVREVLGGDSRDDVAPVELPPPDVGSITPAARKRGMRR